MLLLFALRRLEPRLGTRENPPGPCPATPEDRHIYHSPVNGWRGALGGCWVWSAPPLPLFFLRASSFLLLCITHVSTHSPPQNHHNHHNPQDLSKQEVFRPWYVRWRGTCLGWMKEERKRRSGFERLTHPTHPPHHHSTHHSSSPRRTAWPSTTTSSRVRTACLVCLFRLSCPCPDRPIPHAPVSP